MQSAARISIALIQQQLDAARRSHSTLAQQLTLKREELNTWSSRSHGGLEHTLRAFRSRLKHQPKETCQDARTKTDAIRKEVATLEAALSTQAAKIVHLDAKLSELQSSLSAAPAAPLETLPTDEPRAPDPSAEAEQQIAYSDTTATSGSPAMASPLIFSSSTPSSALPSGNIGHPAVQLGQPFQPPSEGLHMVLRLHRSPAERRSPSPSPKGT
jgi:hypothetical protein